MARVHIQPYDAPHPGAFIANAFSRAGDKLSAGIQGAYQARLRERALDIEEARAKVALMREQAAQAAREQKQAEADAEKRMVGAEVQDLLQGQAAQAQVAGLRDAVAGGADFGPMGAGNPRMAEKAMRAAAETKARLAEKVALAKHMSGPAARAYLEREAKREKANAVSTSFKDLLADVGKAEQVDGVLTPDEANQFRKDIAESMRSGKGAGPARALLAKKYELHSKLQARAERWQAAGKEAVGLIQTMRDLVSKAPDEKTAQAAIGKLNEAQGAWASTQFPSYQRENDPDAALGAIKKLLYGSMATSDPAGSLEMADLAHVKTPSQEDVVRAITGTAQRAEAPPGGSLPVSQPATPPEKPQETGKAEKAPRGLGAKRAANGAKLRPASDSRDKMALAKFVADNAGKALSVDGDRVAATAELIRGIRETLGIDPHDPQATAIIREMLDRARTGGG